MSYSEILLSTHAFVPKNELKLPIETLKKKLTLTSRYDETLSIPLYGETATHFGYPLYLHPYADYTEHLQDRRSEGNPITVRLREGVELRDNQKPLLAKFEESLHQGDTGWLLTMPTGAGKTVCALAMLTHIKRTTLIIVPRDNLMNQWEERILEFTDLKTEDIGHAQQSVCDYAGKKVVLGMIHSLARDKYPKAFAEYFGLVIWDEVHVAGAQSFSQTLSLFAPKYRIGMSATLKRRDGLDGIYTGAIGERKLAIESRTLLAPKVYTLEFTPGKVNRRLNFISNANFRRAKLISLLAEDKGRNALIADQIAEIHTSGRRIVVFSERILQLHALKELLATKNIPDEEIGIFTGETKETERTRILRDSRIILATYGVMAMGVDVPDLRALVFATPQSGVAQPVGRILRLNEDALEPVVIDIIDRAYLDCLHWAKARERYYKDIAKASFVALPPVVMPPEQEKKKSSKKRKTTTASKNKAKTTKQDTESV